MFLPDLPGPLTSLPLLLVLLRFLRRRLLSGSVHLWCGVGCAGAARWGAPRVLPGVVGVSLQGGRVTWLLPPDGAGHEGWGTR